MVQRLVRSFRQAHPIKQGVLVLWALLFFGGIIFSSFFLPDILKAHGGLGNILEHFVGSGFSVLGVGIFLLLFILRNFLFIPISLLLVLAPIFFGSLWYGILIAGGCTIVSSCVGFIFARYYGKEFVTGSSSKMIKILNEKLEERGVLSIILLRIIPVFPADIINFGAGLSKIPFRDFLWATVLSVWPDCFFYGFLGGSLKNPISILYTVIFGLFVFFLLWYLKNHPEYKDLFIMKLKKRFSRTRKKFRAFRKKRRKKRF